MTTGYQQYRTTQTETADSGELLLMLYDGAIRFVRRAAEAIEAGDVRAKCEAIARAFAIVAELHATLDFEADEELTANLSALYLFVLESLAQANAAGDRGRLETVEAVLTTLREGWEGAVREVRALHRESRAPARNVLSVVAVSVHGCGGGGTVRGTAGADPLAGARGGGGHRRRGLRGHLAPAAPAGGGHR
ncbi:MAG: flagellar export chaperone FliS [Nitrospirae bacterium]|nr:MAG: flagellar export chaperone FliS [Nitrospirota bacterium]